MVRAKAAVIGAGSSSFGLSVLKHILLSDALDGIELYLYDIDEPSVRRMGELGRYMVQSRDLDKTVNWGTDLPECLDGADAVIIAVAQDREECWQKDREIGLEFGINHYAENGGPGALFHAARNIGLILPIVRATEKHCPDALLINYTNPVPRICTAIHKYSRMQVVGVCHQVYFGYYLAGVLLSAAIGLELPEDYYFRWTNKHNLQHNQISEAARRKLFIHSVGLNHFTWALAVRCRESGRDLYPELVEANRTFDRGFEPLTRKVFDLFELLPTPGDTHLCEYLPYTHSVARDTWQRNDIQMYDFAWSRASRNERRAIAQRIIEDRELDLLDNIHSERAELLLGALVNRQVYVDEALNLPNRGAIPNLPDGAIVEAPVAVLPDGLKAVAEAPLPEPIAELCRRQALINELSVTGTVEGDKGKLLQALALDPMIDDVDLPVQLLDAGLKAFDKYLTFMK